ncbi:hypothetical protein, partial [Mesorhizobium sp. M7A.F.Ca.CA.001.14.1.1]|uniref:hypothetical protein n=1 Tax=Mesorhizobium sp. M7A.F.Ca.CA.001.14.1.1 TaxID=2496706 RepID=UPI0019D4DDFE
LGSSASGTFVHGLAQAEMKSSGRMARTARMSIRASFLKGSPPGDLPVAGDRTPDATLAGFVARKRRHGQSVSRLIGFMRCALAS